MSEQTSENEPHDQDSEPGSKPTGAAVAETEADGEDPDSGPASVPQDA
jgi:hypothetical protein